MKDKFIKFMQGRYGVDDFAKFTTKNASYLFLPELRSENPYSQRKGKNRDRMSKMPYKIY